MEATFPCLVLYYCTVDGVGIDTQLLFPLLLQSGLPQVVEKTIFWNLNKFLILSYWFKRIRHILFFTDKSTLGQIWTLCNKTCPGQLSVAELFACLSFVGFAQRNPKKNLCLTLIDGFPCVPDLGPIVLGYKDKNDLLLMNSLRN